MKSLISILIILGSFINIYSQSNNVELGLKTIGGYTSNETIPFWLRANQFGSIPLDGASLSLIPSVLKDYDRLKARSFDWGASFEGRMNAGHKTDFTLIEGYGKIKIHMFELKAGRVKEIMGFCDTTLSSGSFAVSGNALGIPKVQASIPEFYTLPMLGKLFAFKGHYNHGWIGNIPMRRLGGDTVNINTFLHQKALYGRFGKPEWKWKLYGGFNHQVLWGNEQTFYTEDFTLSPVETYFYVITGKKYNTGSIQQTRMGAHMGSIEIGFEYELEKIKILGYRQNFYEAGALIHLANIQDGLNGISIQFKQNHHKNFQIKKLLFEHLYTKNQAGEPWSPDTPSPYENYYNHGHYIPGWSYNGTGLGTPFISTRSYLREDLPSAPEQYFINNRVSAFHIGLEGSVMKWDYLVKSSWSKNFGTYWTTDEEQTTDIPDPGIYGIFGKREQLSVFLELSRALKNGFNIGFMGALDHGDLYYNSSGILISLSKSFSL